MFVNSSPIEVIETEHAANCNMIYSNHCHYSWHVELPLQITFHVSDNPMLGIYMIPWENIFTKNRNSL